VIRLTYDDELTDAVHRGLGDAACPERMAAELLDLQSSPACGTFEALGDRIGVQAAPRNIPEEDMWLRSLPPDAENPAVEQPLPVVASVARPSVSTTPKAAVAPSSQIVTPPSQLPGLPLFNQGQATDPSTNM
jgi:hypothetical protein